MTSKLRSHNCLQWLATIALGVSTAANAFPAQVHSDKRDATAPVVARPDFPASLIVDGTRYDRLTGVSLDQAVRGKTFCPSPPCSGIDGRVEVFRNDGTYVVAEDRWDDGGRYKIINDVVVTELVSDGCRTFAVYRSTGGAIRRGFRDGAGVVRLMREFIK